MACTGAKVINTCGAKQYSVCVYYEGEIPEFSSLTEEECINIQEVAEDLYDLVGDLRDRFDFESLREGCITYPVGTLTLLQVLQTHQNEICALKATQTAQAATIATMQQQILDLQNNTCP